MTGVVFLLVGVLGFAPGITTHYDTMEFASHDDWLHFFHGIGMIALGALLTRSRTTGRATA
ncbi:DUF4383 domain-containing protein [Streptomyces tauricus]|uniref:DUF4383 domain-containing protein n=1 Tax=Streptomyces tauricus TaxID=68274 RepID=UPI00343C7BB2